MVRNPIDNLYMNKNGQFYMEVNISEIDRGISTFYARFPVGWEIHISFLYITMEKSSY